MIHGRPVLGAQTMIALIKRSGAAERFALVESTDKRATWECIRRGEKLQTETFTIEDAKRAGLIDRKDSLWPKYPKQLLCWRAASMLARREFPDIIAGLYTPDELRDGVIDIDSVETAPVPEATVQVEQPAAIAADDRPILREVKRELIALVGKERAAEVWAREISPGPDEGLVERAREWMAAERRLQAQGAPAVDSEPVCEACDGSAAVKCPECEGEGRVDCHTPMHEHGLQYDGHPCPRCHGDLKVRCPRCKGAQKVACIACAPIPEGGQAGLKLDKGAPPEPPPIEHDRAPGADG
jgi:hypothetical protein